MFAVESQWRDWSMAVHGEQNAPFYTTITPTTVGEFIAWLDAREDEFQRNWDDGELSSDVVQLIHEYRLQRRRAHHLGQ